MKELGITGPMHGFLEKNREAASMFDSAEVEAKKLQLVKPRWLWFREYQPWIIGGSLQSGIILGLWQLLQAYLSSNTERENVMAIFAIFFLLLSFVAWLVAVGLSHMSPRKVRARLADDQERTRVSLYRFIRSIKQALRHYNYAVRCCELGALPERMVGMLDEAHDQLSKAITYADHKVRLWQLREEGQALKGSSLPSIGLEWEKLRDSIENIGEIAGTEELVRVEERIQGELAILDVQDFLGVLPNPQEL